ncbi:Hypothetical_protein [Hexamita inflata]|uniref:Hypothetical_protein n=1 Tax=Hexamita inflata TaxID=28002 RepID=A0AA86QEV7_9EUKA|nr:Hypothetical protein HINF_LOCUS43211 [Hexamita inflata]
MADLALKAVAHVPGTPKTTSVQGRRISMYSAGSQDCRVFRTYSQAPVWIESLNMSPFSFPHSSVSLVASVLGQALKTASLVCTSSITVVFERKQRSWQEMCINIICEVDDYNFNQIIYTSIQQFSNLLIALLIASIEIMLCIYDICLIYVQMLIQRQFKNQIIIYQDLFIKEYNIINVKIYKTYEQQTINDSFLQITFFILFVRFESIL